SAVCTDEGRCVVELHEGTFCENSCTREGTCQAGRCVGIDKDHLGQLLNSLFAFGGAAAPLGAALLLDEDHALFADRLGVGTLLSLVSLEGVSLRVLAQHLTSVQLTSLSFSPDVWESHPETHFVSWRPDRFALVNGRDGIQ